MFIVNGLNLFKVIVEKTYRVRKGIGYVHVNKNPGIGNIFFDPGFLCNFYELSQIVSNVF